MINLPSISCAQISMRLGLPLLRPMVVMSTVILTLNPSMVPLCISTSLFWASVLRANPDETKVGSTSPSWRPIPIACL